MKAVTNTSLRSRTKANQDEVIQSGETVIVQRNNASDDAGVLMPLKEYNLLKETEYLLSTEANRSMLEKYIARLNAGKTVIFPMENLKK